MLLGYSIYLVRATVSAMIALFVIFVRRKNYISTKYRYAHIGFAVASLLDLVMDITACCFFANGVSGFDFHWIWAVVYYIEWTVLGFCVFKLIESPHGFFWIPPLMVWYVVSDSITYRRRIDDVYSGAKGEMLHELSRVSPMLLFIYMLMNVVDLSITDNIEADLVVVCLSTVVVVFFAILVMNLQPDFVNGAEVVRTCSGEKPASSELSGIEAKVHEWESRPDKPYCKEEVTLFNVADQMRVSSRVLSSYLNSVKMMNFNTWINALRVEEVKRLLRNDPDIDFYDIMIASGFQSRASLSRALKSCTGRTLSELRRLT